MSHSNVILEIKALVKNCYDQAREQLNDQEKHQPFEYRLQNADLDYICNELGGKPSPGQWKNAGVAWVGSKYCSTKGV